MVPGVLTISTSPEQQHILNLQYKVSGKIFDSAVLIDMEPGLFTKWPHLDLLGWLGTRKQTGHKNDFRTFFLYFPPQTYQKYLVKVPNTCTIDTAVRVSLEPDRPG